MRSYNLLLVVCSLLLTGCTTVSDLFGEAPLVLEHPVVHFVHPESSGKFLHGRAILSGNGGSKIQLINDMDEDQYRTDVAIDSSVNYTGLFWPNLFVIFNFQKRRIINFY